MNRRTFGGSMIGVALLALVLTCVLSGCNRRDVVVMTTKSPKGESASIVAHKDSILGTYSADLILCSSDGRIIQRTNLVQSRDDIEDVRIEFLSLEFRGDAVHLVAKGLHYHGTNEFRFSN